MIGFKHVVRRVFAIKVDYRIVEIRRGGRVAIRRNHSNKIIEFNAMTLARCQKLLKLFDTIDEAKIVRISQLSLSSSGRIK